MVRHVNLFLLQDQLPVVGDFVVVHVGYAIQIIAADSSELGGQGMLEELEDSPLPRIC